MTGPLAGVRVVEITSVVLGPFAAQILGDLGAEVIKIEPHAGDTTRNIGPARNPTMGSMFLGINRNKRSVVLDLKQPAGRAAALKLAAGADVLLHNLRPGAAKRLGLSYDDVSAINPKIIYCATYGYRAAGPYAEHPAYDDIIQAKSAVPELQRAAQGEPHYMPSVVADKTTALTVVYAINAALFHRERSGEGQAIEVPMFETMVAFIMPEHLFGQTFVPPMGSAGYVRVLSLHRKPQKTKDGYIAVLPHTDAHWRYFLGIAGRDDVLKDERFKNVGLRTQFIDDLYGQLADIIAERTTAEWLELLDPAKLPLTALNTPDELIDDPQLNATGFWQESDHPSEGPIRMTDQPIGFSETPGTYRRHAPRLGEQSIEVLREAGLEEAEIEAMLADGVTVDGAA
ncbi:MAG: CoA transferase [Rhodospirillaceae bacterium]|nr:CoA transferase [Rhodospirillaceae bacterium]MBT4688077.1 CoA transferase [Rhodospirillaceae bacterium]MBT5081741.1 CoA transferase [Rhodospirillaceae bacterium]MBT5527397.1 CoA transferase [Rhodospirillaceae bacterium]MBT5880686.1 CoA transferase [Rhodospirillaceae bacterium]